MSRPKVEYGYDFDGSRIGRVTFDLNAPDLEQQMEEFFAEHPEITVGDEDEGEQHG